MVGKTINNAGQTSGVYSIEKFPSATGTMIKGIRFQYTMLPFAHIFDALQIGVYSANTTLFSEMKINASAEEPIAATAELAQNMQVAAIRAAFGDILPLGKGLPG